MDKLSLNNLSDSLSRKDRKELVEAQVLGQAKQLGEDIKARNQDQGKHKTRF